MPVLPTPSIRDEPLPPKKSLPFKINVKHALAVVGVFVFVVTLLITTYLLLSQKQAEQAIAAAKVGSEIISRSQAKNFADECNLSQKEAVGYLVDEKVLTKWSADEQISIPPEEQKFEENKIGSSASLSSCTSLKARVNLLREKLQQNTQKFREGQFVSINFGLYSNPKPYQPIPGVSNEEERVAKLKEHRAYADKLVNQIYPDLKSGRISFEQAMELVNKDPLIGESSLYKTSILSRSFSATEYIEKRSILGEEDVRKKVDSLAESQISEPFIQKSNQAACNKEDPKCIPNFVEIRWLIFKVERIGEGYSQSSEELINFIRKKYNAQIYT